MQRAHYEKEVRAQDASRLRIGVVVSEFNADITEAMLAGALKTLDEWKVKKANITVLRVPGSFEIPFGALTLLSRKKKPHAIVALGCIIKGETEHDRYIASAVSHGIMDLMLAKRVPISFGIITTNNLKQAQARSSGTTNKGREAALAALRSALQFA
jgi:6,7-dimethyl-8-ribityllumazine synthase